MSVLKELGFVNEGVIDGVFEVSDLREAADGKLMSFDVVPDRLDARLLGAVPREVNQLDVGRGQEWLGRHDGLAGMDRVIVQSNHQGALTSPVRRGVNRTAGDVPEEGHQALG